MIVNIRKLVKLVEHSLILFARHVFNSFISTIHVHVCSNIYEKNILIFYLLCEEYYYDLM